LIEYIEKLEVTERGVVFSDELSDLLRDSKLDMSSIGLEKAIEHYEMTRELERLQMAGFTS